MRAALFIVLCCAVIGVRAQQRKSTVSGYVRDGSTGEVLAGAVIAAGDGAARTVANPSGYFSLQLPSGRHVLDCSCPGYQSATARVGQDTLLSFSLIPVQVALESVVVEANNGNPVRVNDLGNVGISMQQLKYVPLFLGERDVIKFMQMLPGVSAGREGSSQLNVRGGGGDQTLLMLDEVPIFNQNHAFGVVSIFNGDALSGAELYKGYIPARYGGRLSSVAAITMRDGNKYEHHQALTIGTLTAGLLAEGPLKRGKGSYLFSARGFIPGLLLPVAWEVLDKDLKVNYGFYDITAKVNYELGQRNSLFASFYTGRDRFSVKEVSAYDDRQTGKRIITSENGMGYDWGNLSGSLRLNTILGHNAFMNNSLYFSRLSNGADSFFKDREVGGRMHSDVNSALYEAGVRSSVEQRFGTAHKVNYGLNASMQHFTPQTTVYERNHERTRRSFDPQRLYSAALFAEDRITTGIWTVDLGARMALYSRDSDPVAVFEPRLGVAAALDRDHSVWLSLTRSTQPLFAVTKMDNGLPIDFWLPYTDKIESAWQVSTGWRTSAIKNLTLTVEGYYKRMDNLTLIQAVDDYLLEEADPLPASGYAWGLELLAQYNLPRFSVTGAYTYSRSMRRAEGVTFPYLYDTPHDVNIFASYTTLKRDDRRHTLSLNVGYRTGLPYSIAAASYPGAGAPFPFSPGEEVIYDTPRYPNTRMPDFFRTDLSFIMERQRRSGVRTWQFSILNATNHFNPIMIYPSERSSTGYRAANLIPFMPSFSYRRTF